MILARMKDGKFRTFKGVSGKGTNSVVNWDLINTDDTDFCYAVSIPDFDHYTNGSTTSINNYVNYINAPGNYSFNILPNVNVDTLLYRLPVNSADTQVKVVMGIVSRGGADIIGFNIYVNGVFTATAPTFTDYTGEFEFAYVIGKFYAKDLNTRDATMGYELCSYHKCLIHILTGNTSNDNKVIGYFAGTSADSTHTSQKGSIFPLITTDQAATDLVTELGEAMIDGFNDVDERLDDDEQVISSLGGDIGQMRDVFVSR